MAGISVGDVVFVKFPFSDLQEYKRRPALVLAETTHADFVLCQITSRKYADKLAIKIKSEDFRRGTLKKDSYVRAEKLFTANDSIIDQHVGKLNLTAMQKVRKALAKLFQINSPEGYPVRDSVAEARL